MLLIAGACGSESADTFPGLDETSSDFAVDDLDFALTTVDGSETSLTALVDGPTVINFFAAWCGPCRLEMPAIEATHQALGDEVTFLGVSHDFDEADWHKFVDDTGVSFETFFQPGQEIFLRLELFGMPSTIFVDADGNVVHTHSGIVTEDSLLDLISEHLSVET